MKDAIVSDQKIVQDLETPAQVDRQQHLNRWLEVISAILISLATVASAWCAYQSTRWNGVQAISFSEANSARTESVRMSNTALQLTSIDIGMFVQFVAAYSDGNLLLADYLLQRFRPEMKHAVDAWIATTPLKNPKAPLSPFAMAEYKSAAQEESNRLLELAETQLQEAVKANQRSDNYVMLTVLFASVLFFGGMSTKFDFIKIRVGMTALAIIIFTIVLIILATYPIH